MIFSFANNTILSCLLISFLNFDLYLLYPAVITQTFNTNAELVIIIGTPTKEAKADMETHPVIVEIAISE